MAEGTWFLFWTLSLSYTGHLLTHSFNYFCEGERLGDERVGTYLRSLDGGFRRFTSPFRIFETRVVTCVLRESSFFTRQGDGARVVGLPSTIVPIVAFSSLS